MKTEGNPPGKRKIDKRQPRAADKRKPAPDKEPPRAAEGSGAAGGPSKNENPSPEEVISTWRKPVTNQDEQEKITNAGGEDIPIADN